MGEQYLSCEGLNICYNYWKGICRGLNIDWVWVIWWCVHCIFESCVSHLFKLRVPLTRVVWHSDILSIIYFLYSYFASTYIHIYIYILDHQNNQDEVQIQMCNYVSALKKNTTGTVTGKGFQLWFQESQISVAMISPNCTSLAVMCCY